MTSDKVVFHFVKLPLIFLLITLGIILEFCIELPFRVLCAFDRWFGRPGP
jgi:hypothetical protein